MSRLLTGALALTAVAGLAACSDTGARKDLPQSAQSLDQSQADIIVMPDRFPNLAHKCRSGALGIWTTTDRLVVLLGNDHQCEGFDPARPPYVIFSNIPGTASARFLGTEAASG